MKKWSSVLLGATLACNVQAAQNDPLNVMVVMSYEENNPWCQAIKRGIDIALGPHAQATYFYMDTKVAPQHGPKMADKALLEYQRLQPDGLIAVDDNAQSMFVVPFLKDKVSTPVMFAGVNAAADKYGYPNQHISGILERAHVRESLAFAKQLLPDISNACFVTNDVPSGHALKKQVESEKKDYPMNVHDFYPVSSISQLTNRQAEIKRSCDLLFVDSLEGIKDDQQRPLVNKEVIEKLNQIFGGPLLGGNRYQVEQGAWAAVVKTGQEQGETAAEMLLKAMSSEDASNIPVVKNTKGERVVNVTALDKNNVLLKPLVLRGATLVRQQP